ncbi:uncharacterized protein LOC144168350 [Haemaphysalis longicornis]
MGLVYLVFQERGPYPRSHSLAEYPVLCCYYDPAWSNKTQHGDWAYDLTRDFHHEQCTHAVFVGARYSHLGVTLPESASAALPAFLSLRRGGLSMLASVLVEDTIRAAEDASRFADTVVDWLRKHDFDGLDLDLRDPATAHGYDLLVKALIPEMRRPGQRLILSVNVYPATRFMDDVNVKQLQQDADFLVLNVQDLVDPDQRTAAPSALYGRHSWYGGSLAMEGIPLRKPPRGWRASHLRPTAVNRGESIAGGAHFDPDEVRQRRRHSGASTFSHQ